jgi:cyclopropane fatty-acyl-phospholipid synthase-like methyltransferase
MDDADLTDPAVAADYDLAYADRDAQVERLKTVLAGHLPVVEGGWLLDVACGSGLASEAASMLGYAVIGVDESPAMLALAAQRLPRADLRLASADAIDAATTNPYHAVVSVGNGLVLLPRERLAVALRGMRARLRRDGTMLVMIRDFTERPKSAVWRSDGVATVRARFADGSGRALHYVLEIEDAKGPRAHQLTLHPVSPIELAVAIDAAGMRVVRTQTLGGWIAVSATLH